MGKIVAIGGGENGHPKEDGSGFFPYETEEIDRRILELTGKSSPRVLFVPTASGDSASYHKAIKKNFMKLGASAVDVLNLLDGKLTNTEIKKKLSECDAVYVGGGNTLRLMNVWRKTGFDKLI